MLGVFEDYLFSCGYLVASEDADGTAPAPHQVEVLVALARLFAIRVTAAPELADAHMLQVAARCLGRDVPEPFYRGFPQTVRDLTPDALLLDQLLHYARTYGMGDFGERGHSAFEDAYVRTAFAEDVEPRPFAIITVAEAEALLGRVAEGLLASTRPLNGVRFELLAAYVEAFGAPASCASKDTVCRLLARTRDVGLARLMALPDVIRLVEWMIAERYPGQTMRTLNLANQDRKLVCAVLDELLARRADERDGATDAEFAECLEKRRLWKGLLHHLRYRPRSERGRAFCDAMRNKTLRSAYGDFEARLQEGDVRGATDVLRAAKGPGAVLRRMNHLLSRCTCTDDVEYVLAAVETKNRVLLIQLLMSYELEPCYGAAASGEPAPARTFVFTRLGLFSRHTETPDEVTRRKTVLGEELRCRVRDHLRERLEHVCHGTLGAVYASESMRRVALPLRDASSASGFGTLSCGTRLPLPADKVVRAFTYWERADDVDLSCIGLGRGVVQEFSWRSMWAQQSMGIAYSGDETSGWKGGSEYFDVDVAAFGKSFPNIQTLVFCGNLYSGGFGPGVDARYAEEPATFADFDCRAGYMLRGDPDAGGVFEPKTVQSSFAVTCRSRSAYLFAIDLTRDEFVWLNLGENSRRTIAGTANITFLEPYLRMTEVMSLYDYAHLLATTVVETPDEADVVFCDDELELRPGAEQIRSRDYARIVELL